VIATELHFSDDRDYNRALSFVQVAASIIGQAVKVSQLVDDARKGLLEENIHLREELKQRYDFSNIIGNSSGMREVYERITQVARTNTTVLIRGESGTGKELIAHAIHYNSLRSGKPFILKKGESISQRVAVLVHRGDVETGWVADRYARFIAGAWR